MSEELRRDLYEEYKCIREEYGAYAANDFAEDCGADFTDLISAEQECQEDIEYPL